MHMQPTKTVKRSRTTANDRVFAYLLAAFAVVCVLRGDMTNGLLLFIIAELENIAVELRHRS